MNYVPSPFAMHYLYREDGRAPLSPCVRPIAQTSCRLYILLPFDSPMILCHQQKRDSERRQKCPLVLMDLFSHALRGPTYQCHRETHSVLRPNEFFACVYHIKNFMVPASASVRHDQLQGNSQLWSGARSLCRSKCTGSNFNHSMQLPTHETHRSARNSSPCTSHTLLTYPADAVISH